MKTLIITGTAKPKNDGVEYDLNLFGQSPDQPLAVYIRPVKLVNSDYYTMEDVCRAEYAKYFNTDLYNIISLVNLHIIY
jgi:hypothetical protein